MGNVGLIIGKFTKNVLRLESEYSKATHERNELLRAFLSYNEDCLRELSQGVIDAAEFDSRIEEATRQYEAAVREWSSAPQEEMAEYLRERGYLVITPQDVDEAHRDGYCPHCGAAAGGWDL